MFRCLNSLQDVFSQSQPALTVENQIERRSLRLLRTVLGKISCQGEIHRFRKNLSSFSNTNNAHPIPSTDSNLAIPHESQLLKHECQEFVLILLMLTKQIPVDATDFGNSSPNICFSSSHFSAVMTIKKIFLSLFYFDPVPSHKAADANMMFEDPTRVCSIKRTRYCIFIERFHTSSGHTSFMSLTFE